MDHISKEKNKTLLRVKSSLIGRNINLNSQKASTDRSKHKDGTFIRNVTKKLNIL